MDSDGSVDSDCADGSLGSDDGSVGSDGSDGSCVVMQAPCIGFDGDGVASLRMTRRPCQVNDPRLFALARRGPRHDRERQAPHEEPVAAAVDGALDLGGVGDVERVGPRRVDADREPLPE